MKVLPYKVPVPMKLLGFQGGSVRESRLCVNDDRSRDVLIKNNLPVRFCNIVPGILLDLEFVDSMSYPVD